MSNVSMVETICLQWIYILNLRCSQTAIMANKSLPIYPKNNKSLLSFTLICPIFQEENTINHK